MNPYYMKSMTPSAFESALRQKEGELASYMSRLVCIAFFLNFMLKVLLVITYLHAVCCIVHSGAEFSQCVSCVDIAFGQSSGFMLKIHSISSMCSSDQLFAFFVRSRHPWNLSVILLQKSWSK